MPVTIRTAEMKYKNAQGNYVGINGVADRAINERLAEIEAAGAATIANVNQAVSDAQFAVSGITAQRDTMIASIASVAGQGTDTTLTQSGVAADAKAVGESVEALNSAITKGLYLFANNEWTWSQGAVNGSKGGGIVNANYIRIGNVQYNGLIDARDGLIGIYVWDENQTYLGFWDGTGYVKQNYISAAVIHSGIIDLSTIVPVGGEVRFVYITTDEAHRGDTTYSSNVKTGQYVNTVTEENMEQIDTVTPIVYNNQKELNTIDSNYSWKKGSIELDTGSTHSTSNTFISANADNSDVSIVCTQGYFYICVYNSSLVYIGWWDGEGNFSKETTGLKTWNANEIVNLHDIVSQGYYYRIAFRPGGVNGGTATLADAQYLRISVKRLDKIEQEIEETNVKFENIQVARDFTNASHCNAAFGRPQAIRINYLRDQIYVGYLDNEGNQGVMSYNVNTGAIIRVNLRKSVADDHNQMMICELSNHKILAICADHASNSQHYCYRSVNAEDISEFEQVANIVLPSGYVKTTYTQIVKLSGAIYVFIRAYLENDQTTECWGYSYTTDNGDTWSEPKMFVKATGKKYYACAYKYNDTKIKVYLFSNYSSGQTDIRFCYIDLANSAIIDVDGSTTIASLSSLTDPLEYTVFTIIQSKGDYRLQLIEGYDGTDNSYIVSQYRQANQSIKCASIYCLYDETNNTWQQINFPYSMGDNISSGVPNELIRVDSNTFIASRHPEGYWVLEKYSFQNGSFSFVSEIARTKADSIGLIRPLFADGVIVYLRGTYANYLNYDVDSCIHFLA